MYLNAALRNIPFNFRQNYQIFEKQASYIMLSYYSKALGPLDIVCKVTELVEPICFNLKIFDLMCGLVDFVSDSIVNIVMKGLTN